MSKQEIEEILDIYTARTMGATSEDEFVAEIEAFLNDRVIEELEEIIEVGYDHMSKTYSPDWVFTALNSRLKELKAQTVREDK